MKRGVPLLLALACAPPPVADLHVDLPYALYRRHDAGTDVSADRLARGHVVTMVTPLFVEGAYAMDPARVRDEYDATWRALTGVSLGTTRTIIAFEGADGLDGNAWDLWRKRGACVVGLVHDHDNALAGSSTDPASPRPGKGLSAAGRALAERVVATGGVLDLAHASDASMDDLLAVAAGSPVIDSHTGMRGLADTRRNLDDAHAVAIGRTGGLVAISMHSGHVGSVPGEPATLADVVRHIDYARKLVGVEHVAIGSDFAGAIVPPTDADGEASWPRLAALLRADGWDDRSIRALFFDNAERVLKRC